MTMNAHHHRPLQFLVDTPGGRTTSVSWNGESAALINERENDCSLTQFQQFLDVVVQAAGRRDDLSAACLSSTRDQNSTRETRGDASGDNSDGEDIKRRKRLMENVYLVHQGKVLNETNFCFAREQEHSLQMRLRIRGGTDRQNRVGSKFGGGGVSSGQQSDRERKDRLKKLALESIDLAKDPYLVRNHLGSYECKLCLTLHRDEANYLAHTQGKKHQQGLARRAHLEKLKEEQEGTMGMPMAASTKPVSALHKVRIGRPAYQVFKSRDAETNQRCLSFELQYPEIEEDFQPRHRFMSAFEQQVESPPDRRYQYMLFAAEPYETVAFKIPNEPIDKGENRFVTHWDSEGKKFTVTLYFEENGKSDAT